MPHCFHQDPDCASKNNAVKCIDIRVSVHHDGQRVDQYPARAKPVEIRDHIPRLEIRADNFDGFEFGILRLQH